MPLRDYDAKKYKCYPWQGQRGPSWERYFKPEFENAIRDVRDNFSNLHQWLFGMDFGGWEAGAPNHIAGAGALAAQNAMSIQARKSRGDTYIHLLNTHILNQDILDAVNLEYTALIGRAPAAPPAGPGGAAVAGVRPTDWGMQMWRWLHITYGRANQTGLLESNQDTNWANTKITDVGIDRETIRRFYSHLSRLNREMVTPVPAIKVWTKFMSQITFPRLLSDMAQRELQNPTFVFAGGPNVGQPDLLSAVGVFEEMWQSIYDKGIEIKPQAAPAPRGPPTNRVDGMMLSIHDRPTEYYQLPPQDAIPATAHHVGAYNWVGLTDADIYESYVVATGTEAFAFLKDERNCWVCRGWGHTKDKCPSAKHNRPLAACIQGLQQLQSQQSERLRNMQSSRRVRRPGPSPRNANRAAQSNAVEALIEYDDGGVYTADGVEIVSPPVQPVTQPDTELPTPSMHSTQIVEPQPSAPTESDEVRNEPNAPPAAMPETNTTVTIQNLDATIEQQFQSTMHMAAESVGTAADDPFVRKAPGFNKIALACTTAFAFAGAIAMGLRTTRGKAMLALLAIACPAQSMYTRDVEVHSSAFGRAYCLDVMQSDGKQHRHHGIVDSGTTQCASGRKKLFPDALVERYNPPVKVEIASGVLLQVALQGGMQMKVRKRGVNGSAKKTYSLVVPHSFYVPPMPVTLVSTKALFRLGIRCYFNDELVLILPNGDRIEFVETPTNYTLLFVDDTEEVNIFRTPRSTVELSGDGNPRAAQLTLREPLPLTWDLVHSRFMDFSLPKIAASAPYLTDMPFDKLGSASNLPICPHCVRGAFRGHRLGTRPPGKWTRFAQRIYSDSCRMPKSTPFGWTYMYIFYDAYSKFIAIYFGKSTTAAEMISVFKQFVTDYGRYMTYGKVEEWYTDGGPEFSSNDTDAFCNEMSTRHRYIAPWNPWMNVAETGWRVVLRPLRISFARANVSRALWPFAISQIVLVHNALVSYSTSATEGHFARAFIASLASPVNSLRSSMTPPGASPYFLVTGKKFNASVLRNMFCEIEIRIRSKDDLKDHPKTDPITYTGMHLGIASRAVGYLVYIFDKARFTTASMNDVVFFENKYPRLDKIVGTLDINGTNAHLPTEEQQNADNDDGTFPELDDIVRPVPVQQQQQQPQAPAHHGNVAPGYAHSDADGEHYSSKQCSNPRCQVPSTNGRHDDRDDRHSFERVSGRRRDASNILEALDNDPTGTLAPCGHQAFIVGSVETGNELVLIGYNTQLAEYGDVQLPSGTKEALNGPQSDDWHAAYQRDLAAKLANNTFSYVRRPTNKRVVKTKVAHALKRDVITNAIDELRARWVGMGFLQGLGDFNATYCATPSATSCRLFLCIVLRLGLSLAQGDVTKAFTLNPIDVELYCEQMPGMEVAGNFPGATIQNTVCLMHKCLEGLKQAGNIWQTTHTEFLITVKLLSHFTFKQSEIEPCIFVMHCSKGIMLILVWVDDILVAFSCQLLYDTFLTAYSKRFPSKHKPGCSKFAGLSIDYQPRQSLSIHQHPHIELAYEKFVADKVAARRSSAIHRLAVADKSSPHHYSTLALAASDQERAVMKTKPFLPALATTMYYTHWTQPHLAYHCAYLGQFMHDPSPPCFNAVIDMIIYSYHNRNLDVITYKYTNFTLPRQIPESRRDAFTRALGWYGFCDASWLLRSVSGYVMFMCDGPIDWSSKLIRVICHSSSEAEIAAGCFVGKRSVFVKQLSGDMTVIITMKFSLLIDNTAADDLSKKLGVQTRTAHFLRWQHYLRWLVLNQFVEIFFVSTKEQLADMFTKVLDMSTYLYFCRMLYQRRRLSKS